jgi:hypothetical protein
LVDDSVAATFASFHVTVFDSDFVDEVVGESGDLVAGSIAVFELVDKGLEVGLEVSIAFFRIRASFLNSSARRTVVCWGSVIAVLPEGFDGADSSGFYVFEGAVESGEDFGVWGVVVGIGFCELLEGLEDEGF